jgi:hypothetical protein
LLVYLIILYESNLNECYDYTVECLVRITVAL